MARDHVSQRAAPPLQFGAPAFRLPVGEHDLLHGVLQQHGLQVYRLGPDDWYAHCARYDCPSLVDTFAAALEAECPACVTEREVELRRLRLRLRVGSV